MTGHGSLVTGNSQALGLALFLAGLWGVALAPIPAPGINLVEADICIYGGTSGGVAAALAAARLGKRAVLVEPGRHLGGMTSGGLGATDTGNRATIGGISREFYRRIGRHYGAAERFTFEPHVAEEAFSNLLAEAGVPVHFEQRLTTVSLTGRRLASIAMEGGRVFRARMFIDATYEGDLMAQAGVSHTVGREANSLYGETLNGIRGATPGHQFAVNVDPYVVPGNPASGLLPYIQPDLPGNPGDGDRCVQAYNYRLCLTTVATNRLPLEPPAAYDPTRYELLGRYIAARTATGTALTLGSFMIVSAMPNGKTDINNNGAFSTDFIGMNNDYPAANPTGRAALARAHEDYLRGFLQFLASDSRVPDNVRTSLLAYGLCRDEFLDTGGWPHQLYVREARRMVSDYVMTEADCAGTRRASDAVGLASYNMDSHNCRRLVVNGAVRNEGDVQRAPAGPFPISYRALIPRAGECENLFVPFCLSSSHIAFSSCRMEPVFMIASQSAATAAAFALDDDVPVQQVNYAKLRAQLLADGQVLDWGSATAPAGVLVDNADTNGVTIAGNWTSSGASPGYWGTNYLHDANTAKGTNSVRFAPALPADGPYQVLVRWTANANRATNAPIDIVHPAGTNTFLVDQTANGGQWNLLMATNFATGTNASVLIRTDGTRISAAHGFVIADAVLFAPRDTGIVATVDVLATDPAAGEWGNDPGLFTFVRASGPGNVDLPVTFAVAGTASGGADYTPVTTRLVIAAGAVATGLWVHPLADAEPEGPETVTVSLQPGAAYTAGPLGPATVTIADRPEDAWRHAVFDAGDLPDPAISGPDADPDGDGVPNLAEYLLAQDPHNADTGTNRHLRAGVEGGAFTLTFARRCAATDYRLRVDAGTEAAPWPTNGAGVTQELLADDAVVQWLRARHPQPAADAPRAFLRLGATPE